MGNMVQQCQVYDKSIGRPLGRVRASGLFLHREVVYAPRWS